MKHIQARFYGDDEPREPKPRTFTEPPRRKPAKWRPQDE